MGGRALACCEQGLPSMIQHGFDPQDCTKRNKRKRNKDVHLMSSLTQGTGPEHVMFLLELLVPQRTRAKSEEAPSTNICRNWTSVSHPSPVSFKLAVP